MKKSLNLNFIVSFFLLLFIFSTLRIEAKESDERSKLFNENDFIDNDSRSTGATSIDIAQELKSMGFEVPAQPKKAPPFSITDLNGNTVKFEDFTEPLIILNFWVDWCKDSKAEKPKLQKFYTQMQGENYKLFTIHHKGTIQQVKQFMESNGYTMHTGVDFDANNAFGPYGVTRYPTNFVIDNKRNIIGFIDDSVRIAWDTYNVQEKFRKIIEELSNVPEPPVLDFTADKLEVKKGAATTLHWTSENANILTASGAWNGAQSASGNYNTGPLNSDSEFILTAKGDGGEISKKLTIKVKQENVLENGKEANSSLANQGATEIWQINVESGTSQMRTVLNCGNNDYDIYGKLGSIPTTSDYDWRGYKNGSEDVSFKNPGAGTWYIMVRSYSGNGDYKITCYLSTIDAKILNDGEQAESTLSSAGDTEIWKIEVTGNPGTMRTILDSGTNDFDIYGKLGSVPTTNDYDWRGYTNEGEDVTFNNPGNGIWYIMVRSYKGSGKFTIRCSLGSNYTLKNGIKIQSALSDSREYKTWKIRLPAGINKMKILLEISKSNNLDIYGKFNSEPALTNYDWHNSTNGKKAIEVINPGEGTWYIMVQGNGDYTITCIY